MLGKVPVGTRPGTHPRGSHADQVASALLLMPVIPIAGLSIGLSPLLQWIVVPAVAFAITGGGQNKQTDGGRR